MGSVLDFVGAILCAIASGYFIAQDMALPGTLFFLAALIFTITMIIDISKGR